MFVEHYTVDEVERALRQSAGIKTYAAKRLGCHISTVRNYVHRYPHLQDAIDEEREKLLDLAEKNVVEGLLAGDKAYTFFVLRCFGRERGWVERVPHSEQIGATVVVNMNGVPLEDVEVMAGLAPEPQGGQGDSGVE